MSNRFFGGRSVMKHVAHLQCYLYDNIPRGFSVKIFRFSWPILTVFLRFGYGMFPVAIQED